jgi:hypothetical protein
VDDQTEPADLETSRDNRPAPSRVGASRIVGTWNGVTTEGFEAGITFKEDGQCTCHFFEEGTLAGFMMHYAYDEASDTYRLSGAGDGFVRVLPDGKLYIDYRDKYSKSYVKGTFDRRVDSEPVPRK